MSNHTPEPCKNTDKLIWEEVEGDYYSDHIYITKDNKVSMETGGKVISLSIKEWHTLFSACAGLSKEEIKQAIFLYKNSNSKKSASQMLEPWPDLKKECSRVIYAYIHEIEKSHYLINLNSFSTSTQTKIRDQELKIRLEYYRSLVKRLLGESKEL